MMHPLEQRVAVVAGATRGAGRGIACTLGEAGATVYCTGRSVRGDPSSIDRPETIEETAEMVTARGGTGIWAQVDHNDPEQVERLFDRVGQEEGRLDVLVNNMSGDQYLTEALLSGEEHVSFWEYPLEEGLSAQRNGVHTHLITNYHAAPLMIGDGQGLIVEVTDGNRLTYNDVGVIYSFSKTSVVLLAYLMSEELKAYGVTVVSLTPGWLRSEAMIDHFGVTEENWRDVILEEPTFEQSETPFYIGRAVVALASDPEVMEKTGRALSAGHLAREYGFTDVDGRQPPGYSWWVGDEDEHDLPPIREGLFRYGRFGSSEDEWIGTSS
jgi:NAD(P)-dependent dehydrogenase (short-subunit alcohol dehydrogenase family)